MYYILTQLITRLVKVCPEEDFDNITVKNAYCQGVITRKKIKDISRGLKKMGISDTFNMGDILKPDQKIIRYTFSRIIYYYDYLTAFKKQVAPELKKLVESFLKKEETHEAIETAKKTKTQVEEQLHNLRNQMEKDADKVLNMLANKAQAQQALESTKNIMFELESKLKKVRGERSGLEEKIKELKKKEAEMRKQIDVLEGKVVKDPQKIM